MSTLKIRMERKLKDFSNECIGYDLIIQQNLDTFIELPITADQVTEIVLKFGISCEDCIIIEE